MWADEGVKEKRGSKRETEGDRKTKSGTEWGKMTFHNPLFFLFKHYTQYHNHTLKPKHLRQFSYLILPLIFKGINQRGKRLFSLWVLTGRISLVMLHVFSKSS